MNNAWTNKDEEILRKNWGKVSTQELSVLLNRTVRSINSKADKLGIRNALSKWSKEEETTLIKFYGKLSTKDMMKKLSNRTRRSILNKAQKLGLTTPRLKWTSEEDEYLSDSWGIVQPRTLIKNLSRTWECICDRANLLKLGDPLTGNGLYMDIPTISELLGVHRKFIYDLIKNNLLKANRFKKKKGVYYRVGYDDFFNFIEKFPDKWNAKLADIQYIKAHYARVYLKGSSFALTDSTPEWLQRKIQSDKIVKRKISTWTVKEEQELLRLREQGLSRSEISRKMNRPRTSLDIRLTRLINVNNLEKKKLRRWTRAEDELLIKLRDEGILYEEIAPILNRSVKSLSLRIPRLECESKLKRWTSEEDAKLMELYNSKTKKKGNYKGIAKILNRTESSVGSRVRYLKKTGFKASPSECTMTT